MAEPGEAQSGTELPAVVHPSLPAPITPAPPAPAPKQPAAGLFGPVALLGALVAAGLWLWLLVSPEMRVYLKPQVTLGVGLGVAGAAWLGAGLLHRSAFGVRLAALASGDPFGLPWVVPFVVAYYGLRLPLMSRGYGGDPDAWRIAASGIKLWRLGTYEVSRFPGYPVAELGLSPFVVFGGPLVANGVVATVGLLGLLAMDRAGRRLGFPSMGLATLSVAFAPIFLVNTANTMDYVFALSGLLGSLWALCAGRYALAGLFFGLAVGARLPTVVFAAPLGLWVIFGRRAGAGEVARFVTLSVLVAAASYAPVVLEYGLRFFSHTNPDITEESVSEYTVWATGVLPPLLFGGVLADTLRGRGHSEAPEVGDAASNGLLIAGMLAVVLGLYAYLPIQAGYLLPALPFLALLAARLATPAALALLGLGLFVSNAHDLPMSPLRDLSARSAILTEYEALRAAPVPDGSVVMLGGAAFATAFVLGQDLVWSEETPWPRSLHDKDRDIVYMTKLTERQLAKGLEAGKLMFVYSQEVDDWSVRMMGFSPAEKGATVLGIGESGAAAKKKKSKDDKVKKDEKRSDVPVMGDAEAPPADPEAVAEPVAEAVADPVADSEIDQAARWVVDPAKKAGTTVRWVDNRTRVESTKAGLPVSVCMAEPTRARSRVKVLGEWRIREELDMEGLRIDLLWLDDKDAELSRVPITAGQKQPGDWVELKDIQDAPKGATAARLCATLESRKGEVVLDNLRLQQVR